MGHDEVRWGGCLKTIAAEHVEEVACGNRFWGFVERTLRRL